MAAIDLVERDLRLDLFRATSLYLLFLEQLPADNARLLNVRAYGFSDAAAIFVFVFGYTAGFVYGQVMRDNGAVVAAAQIVRRAWQVYVAYVLLLAFYVAEVSFAARVFHDPAYVVHTHIKGLLLHPDVALAEGLFLGLQPAHLGALALYVVLLVAFPPMLWLLLRSPVLALAISATLYAWSRQPGWNLGAFPTGTWRLNPLNWQFLFVLAAWLGIRGGLPRGSRIVTMCAVAYLMLALAITTRPQAPVLGVMIPAWLDNIVRPVNRSDADLAMMVHVLCMALVAVRLVAVDCRALASRSLRPVLLCGRYSLSTFCLGVFLAFAGRTVCLQAGNGAVVHIALSLIGIGLMIAQAQLLAWFETAAGSPPDDGWASPLRSHPGRDH